MKVGDLVKMKDARYHKEIGVIIKVIWRTGFDRIQVHWADGRVITEGEHWLEVINENR